VYRARHTFLGRQVAIKTVSARAAEPKANLRLVREGKEKSQAVGYLNDGTMVVVNDAAQCIGQQAQVQVGSLRQTGAGVIIFAELLEPVHTKAA
jgi:uncharacterized protein YacL